MSKTLGVIVIGAGDMGARHAQHWAAAGARVIGVGDPDLRRAEAIAEPLGARAVTDYRELLQDPAVQVASVCTPTFLHATFSIACLQAGKHVLCEKPIALTLEDARTMRAVAAESKRELRVGFMRRFDPSLPKLLSSVKFVGGPVLANVTVTAGIRPKRLMHARHANGGPIIDMGCHLFDMWRRMFGVTPRLAYARGHTYGPNSPQLADIKDKAVDSAMVVLEYGENTVQLLMTWGLPEGVPFKENHVYAGPEGLVEAHWDYMTNPVHLQDGAGTISYKSGRDPWAAQIAQFHRELSEGAERRLASADDGIEALELSLDILEAIG